MNKRFLIGAATAAHQVEGNNIHSDYWAMEHMKHSDFAEPSGAACDHYHRFEEDIKLLAGAGCNAYRFGIEWARIEPEEGEYDMREIEHYRKVLACCEENGVTPIVTLMHFSSPAWLMRKGGWADPYVSGAFANYARRVMRELGAHIPYACTINEANMGQQLNKVIADMMKAGQRKEGGVQVGANTGLDMKTIVLGMLEQGRAFHCSPFGINAFLRPRKPEKERIVMQAHQAACRAIRSVSPDTRVGLTLSLFDYQPLDGGEAAAAKLWQEDFGWYLPYIENDDFLGVQNYSRKLVDAKGAREPAEGAPLTQMGYEDYPQATPFEMKYLDDYYGSFNERITEYQWPDPFESIDAARDMLQQFLDEIEKGETLLFSILSQTHEFIGSVEVHGLTGDCPELGIWIVESEQNKGHAYEALNAVLDYTNTKYGKDEFYYEADIRNTGSMKLLQKMGNKYEITKRGLEETTTDSGKTLELQGYTLKAKCTPLH